MKKRLLVLIAVFALANLFSTPAASVALAAGSTTESFITEESAIEYAEYLVEEFIDYYAGDADYVEYGRAFSENSIYYAPITWATILDEIGTFKGIKSSKVTSMGAETVEVRVEAIGTRRNAIVEFTIYQSSDPTVRMYSQFSLPTLIMQTDLGPNLLIWNFVLTIALLVAVLFLLLRKKAPEQKAESSRGVASGSAGAVAAKGNLTSDCELVAVIAAAIAAAEGRSSAEGLVVKSIKYKRKAGVRRLA
jgi:hypothetical protein